MRFRHLVAVFCSVIVFQILSVVSTRTSEDGEPEEITPNSPTRSAPPVNRMKSSPHHFTGSPPNQRHPNRGYSPPASGTVVFDKSKSQKIFSIGCDVEELVYRDCMRKQAGLLLKSPSKSSASAVRMADAAVTQTMFGSNSSQPCYQCGSSCGRYCCYSGQACCLYSGKCSCCF